MATDQRKSFGALGKLGKKLKGKKAALEDFIPIFRSLTSEIEKRGLDVEGILRISGSLPEIIAMKKSLVKGNAGDLSKMDVHVATGVLKTLLRELAEPLLMFSNYEPLLKASIMPDENVKVKVMKAIVSNLPAPNRDVLNMLLTLAVHIYHKEDVNRMTPHNIAVVLGPTVLRAQKESLEQMMRDSMQVVKVVEDMIEHYGALFENKTIEIQRPVSLNPQEAEFLRKRAAQLFPGSVDKSLDEWRKEAHQLKEQLRELESKLADETREKEILMAYNAGLDAKVAEESDNVATLRLELTTLQEANETSASSQTQALDSVKADYEEKLKSLESQLADKTSLVATLEASSKDTKQQLATLKTSSSVLEPKLKAAEANVKDLTAQLSTSESKVSTLEKRASKAESSLAEVEGKLSKAEKALSEANASNKEKEKEIEALKKKTTELSSENQSLSQKLKSASSSASSSSSALAPPTTPRELDEVKATLNAKIKTLEGDVSSLQTQFKTATDKASKLEKDNQKLESDVKRGADALTKAEAEAKRVADEKRTMETDLKKAQLSVKTSQAEIESLRKELSETVESSAKAEAEERKRTEANMKKVREERSTAEISMKKAQYEKSQVEIQMKKLQETNTSLTEELTNLKAVQKTHNSALKKVQSERDNFESEWKKLQIMKDSESKRYTQDRAAADAAITRVQEERQKLLSERSRLYAEIEGLTSQITTLKTDVKRLSIAPTKAPEVELQRVRQEKEELATQLKTAQDELSKTMICVTNLEKELQKSQGQDKKSSASSSSPSGAKKGTVANSPFVSGNKNSGAQTQQPLAERERELTEQLFSWMSLSLKLEALLQDRHTESYDSGALLAKLLADRTPFAQWPEIIQKNMNGTV